MGRVLGHTCMVRWCSN